ncbi:MAG: hypothetical protein ACPKM0_05260 [Pleomorphochaeta sp.]
MKKIITIFYLSTIFLSTIIASDGFDFIFDDEKNYEEEDSSSFDIYGDISSRVEIFSYSNKFFENEINPFANLNLIFEYNNPFLLGYANIYIPALDEDNVTYKDMVKELSLSYFIPNGKIQAGYFVHRWGSVDTVRVVDVINANDYSSGLYINQLEMKISEPIILTQFYLGNKLLEFIYKPIFTSIKIASSGRWNIEDEVSSLLIINDSTNIIEPNTNTLEYGSIGIKYAMPIKSIDAAFMYYRGYFEIPGYQYTIVLTPSPPYEVISIETIYTMMNIFGSEFTYLKGPFTFASEVALYLSEDFNSTEESLYNNRLSYTVSVNYKIKDTTSYVTLSYNGCSIFGYDDTNLLDVDTASNLEQNHNIILALHVPLFMEKLLVEAGITYQIPTKGYVVLSKIEYNLKDDITLRVNANLYGTFDNNEDSLYKTFDNNDSLSFSINYQF